MAAAHTLAASLSSEIAALGGGSAAKRDVAVALGGYVSQVEAISSSTAGTSRIPFKASVDCTDIRLLYVNWRPAASNQAETDSGSLTIKASTQVAGTLTPVTFNGIANIVLAPGGVAISDPVGIELAAGTFFDVRTYVSSGTWYASRVAWAAGMGGWTATTDATTSGTINDNSSFTAMPAPAAILGTTKGASVVVIGDSIGYGQGDGAGSGLANGVHPTIARNGSGGFIPHACSGVAGVVNVAVSSDTAQKYAADHDRRGPLSRFARTAVVEYGRNDISTGRTLAQIQADLITIWNQTALRGLRIFQTTITPISTSTDGWRTTGSQTTGGNASVRNAVNAWLRDGAPMSAGAAVAVGTPGAARATLYDGNSVTTAASGPTHILYGIADSGSAAETGSSTGIWLGANNLRSVSDAAATSGGYQLTSTAAAWTSADVGRNIQIMGAGAGGTMYQGQISSYSGTSAFLYDPIGTTVSGATLHIGDFRTTDGVHPAHEAIVAMAAKLPTNHFI